MTSGQTLFSRFRLSEQKKIEDTYNLFIWSNNAPLGYEFTGEFRVPVVGEYFLSSLRSGTAIESVTREDEDYPRLILRKIEDKPAAKPLTAAEVTEKFGKSVLEMFGYGRGLIDFPGFAYTGKIESVIAGEWYVDGAQRIQKLHSPQVSIGSYLTLVPTTPPLPRIVTFTLTEASEFAGDEARYMPREDGSMEPVDTKEIPSQYYYLREEQA